MNEIYESRKDQKKHLITVFSLDDDDIKCDKIYLDALSINLLMQEEYRKI